MLWSRCGVVNAHEHGRIAWEICTSCRACASLNALLLPCPLVHAIRPLEGWPARKDHPPHHRCRMSAAPRVRLVWGRWSAYRHPPPCGPPSQVPAGRLAVAAARRGGQDGLARRLSGEPAELSAALWSQAPLLACLQLSLLPLCTHLHQAAMNGPKLAVFSLA